MALEAITTSLLDTSVLNAEEQDYGLIYDQDRKLGRLIVASSFNDDSAKLYVIENFKGNIDEMDALEVWQLASGQHDSLQMLPWIKEYFEFHHGSEQTPALYTLRFKPQIRWNPVRYTPDAHE